MKRHTIIRDFNARRHYILTNPVRASDMADDDLTDDWDERWREKARRLQARRWRKIRHQIA